MPDYKNIERALELAGSKRTAFEVKHYPGLAICRSILAHARTLQEQDAQGERPYPELLSTDEARKLLHLSENLWADLQQNNLGGYSGINRPFYILNEFKQIIEEFGHRDVGLTWSKNDLDRQGEPVAAIVKDVCELPGDNDPDADDTLILSVDELRVILERHLAAPPTKPQQQPDKSILDAGNARGLYDTSKNGPEFVAYLHDMAGMLASLRDEMSEGYRAWLDDAVDALRRASLRASEVCQQQPQADWLTETLGEILAFADQSNVNEYARCPECSDIETVARAALEKLREAGHG